MLLIKIKQDSDYVLAGQRYLQLLLLSNMFDAQTIQCIAAVHVRHFFTGLDYVATTTANSKEKVPQEEAIRDKKT